MKGLTSDRGNRHEDPNPGVWVRDGLGVLPVPVGFAADSHGELRLILPDPTAIGVGLSHASRTPPSHRRGRGARLSNTWLTYPWDGDNLGKLRLIPDR